MCLAKAQKGCIRATADTCGFLEWGRVIQKALQQFQGGCSFEPSVALWVWVQQGVKGESHCPGMFISPPSSIQAWIMQRHGLEATFAPTWRVCGEKKIIHSCTHAHTGIILLIGSQVDCSPVARRGGGSRASLAGEVEPAMLPVIILSTEQFNGQWYVFNRLSCGGGLDLMSACAWERNDSQPFVVERDLRRSLRFTLSAVAGWSD